MSISFRITLLARITFHGCKIAILFCWYFSVWLLGLQPGPANNSHLRNISQLNSLHIPHVSWTASRRKHKRTRPRTRTLRHMAMKRLRRWVLPVASRHFQECFRQVLLLLLCPRRATQALTRHSLSSAERLAPEHASSELPAKPSRCAPCRVEFVGSNLAALSQADMTSRILSGLDAWCDGLVLPHLQVQQWTADLRLAKPACATRPHNAKVMDTILRVAACVGQLVEMRSVAWEHIQSLNVVLEALCFWIFPTSLRTKRSTSLSSDLLFLACGSLKLVLITAWQAQGGCRKRRRAVKRCLGLPPDVFNAFLASKSWTAASKTAFVQFVSLQAFAGVCEQPDAAVLYQLSSTFFNYVGSTKFGVQRHRCQGSSPVNRAYQHILEHSCLQTPAYAGPPVLRKKCRLFRHARLSDHMFWVLAQGPETYIRALEEASIACFQQQGNSKSIGTKSVQCARRSCASRRNRTRPHRRAVSSDIVHAHAVRFDVWHRAQHRLHARVCTLQDNPLQVQRHVLYKVGFSVGYKIALQNMLLSGLGYGPVDVVRADMAGLLTRYIADTKDPCWESLHQRLKSVCSFATTQPEAACAVHLAKHVRAMPPGSAKLRAQKRMSLHLACFGLVPLRRICVAWPAQIPIWVFRQVAQLLQSEARLRANVHGVWFASLLQPVKAKRCTFADRWRYIQVAQRFSNAFATWPLHKLKPSPADCRQMRRFKLHWKVPVWQSQEALLQEASQTVHWLASKMRCNPPLAFCARVFPTVCKAKLPSGLYSAYCAKFPRNSSAEVLVQEDKDKHAAWSMPVPIYERWCFWMFRQDPLHWQPMHGDAQSICEEYRQLHLRLLPQHLKRFASRERWRSFKLPYAYCTIKSKCFHAAGDVSHICTKRGHSCFRRIISWRAHPASHMYKNAGRAILGIISELAVGFETANLFSAVKDFRSAVNKLMCCSDLCVRCREPKPTLSICVCDAAQMYEELDPSRIRQSVLGLIELLKNKRPSAVGIVVARSRHLRTWVATNDFRHRAASTVWTWSDIVCVLDLALQQRVIRLGKALFRQVIGAPIGGQLSKAIASAVLAFEEFSACNKLLVLRASGFLPSAANVLSDAVANTRYVDDLAMASQVLCTSCLHKLTKLLYAQPVAFEPATREILGFPWLDVWLDSVGGSLTVTAAGLEQAWREAGGAGAPKKFRVVPWLGDHHTDLSEVRGIVAGKLVRWKSLQLEQECLEATVRAELLVWALSGYPAQQLRKIWGRLPHFPKASHIALRTLDDWSNSGLPTCIRSSWLL